MLVFFSLLQFCLQHFFVSLHIWPWPFYPCSKFPVYFTSEITFNFKLSPSHCYCLNIYPHHHMHGLLLPDSKLSLPHPPPGLPLKWFCHNINIKIPSPCFQPVSGLPLIMGWSPTSLAKEKAPFTSWQLLISPALAPNIFYLNILNTPYWIPVSCP